MAPRVGAAAPRVDLRTDVVGCPFEPRGTSARHGGGLLDSDGNLVPNSGYIRRKRELIGPPARYDPDAALVAPDEVLFGGYVMDHYGHFLLDTLARLWATREFTHLPLVWLRGGGFAPWQAAILDLLGVRNPHVFVTRPTRFAAIRVPAPGFSIGGDFTTTHRDFLGAYRATRPRTGARLWLSRSRLDAGRSRIVEELAIEAALSGAGWRIYHPQEHPIHDQLETLATAAEIAGFIGSAFHTLILLQEVTAKVTLFGQPRSRNRQYERIAEVKGFSQRIVEIGTAVSDEKRFWDITVDVAAVCDVLGVRSPA